MNYRNQASCCTIDGWHCNGKIPCQKCPTAYDYYKEFWSIWADEKGYPNPEIELVESSDGFDVFIVEGR